MQLSWLPLFDDDMIPSFVLVLDMDWNHVKLVYNDGMTRAYSRWTDNEKCFHPLARWPGTHTWDKSCRESNQ